MTQPLRGPTALTGTRAPQQSIRDLLAVDVDRQLGYRDEYEALRLWADALQDRGVYVAQRPLRDETIRAFSRVEGKLAVVVVDTGDTAYARIFSLIHEYCHVVLRSTGLCDLDDHSAIERHCNSVAAATLMPTALVATVVNGVSHATSWPKAPQDAKRLRRVRDRRVSVFEMSLTRCIASM